MRDLAVSSRADGSRASARRASARRAGCWTPRRRGPHREHARAPAPTARRSSSCAVWRFAGGGSWVLPWVPSRGGGLFGGWLTQVGQGCRRPRQADSSFRAYLEKNPGQKTGQRIALLRRFSSGEFVDRQLEETMRRKFQEALEVPSVSALPSAVSNTSFTEDVRPAGRPGIEAVAHRRPEERALE